jgi:hypothetical protein
MINFLSTIALVKLKLALIAYARRDPAAVCRQQPQQTGQLFDSKQATLFLLGFNILHAPVLPCKLPQIVCCGAKYSPNCNDQIKVIWIPRCIEHWS